MTTENSLYNKLAQKYLYSGADSQQIDSKVLEDLCDIVEDHIGIDICEHQVINNGDGVCVKCGETT